MTEQEGRSLDMVSENLDALKVIFPEAFSEDGVNFETLRQLLGDAVDEGEEKYGLNWHGEKKARQIALTTSAGTLRPCKEESVDWDTTQNLFIEGDNLEVLKLLQKSYAGKVKMIYIDPPYNTGKEFIYPDKFQDNLDTYLKYTGQKDDEGFKVSTNTESSGRYHTNWLNMMYSRLKLAFNIMRDDGAIFVSIGSEEVKNIMALLEEIFGEENQISIITWEQGRKNDSTFFSENADYIIVFAKNKSKLAELGPWREKKEGVESVLEYYKELVIKHNGDHRLVGVAMRDFYRQLPGSDPRKKLKHFSRSDDRGLYFGDNISSASTSIPDYEIIHPVTHKPVKKPKRGWGATEPVMLHRIVEGRVLFGEDETTVPLKKSYLAEVDSIVKTPVIYKDGRAASGVVKGLLGHSIFNNPKDHEVLADLMAYCLQGDNDAIILDFFAGSASSAHSVLHLNQLDNGQRRFIMIQLPETCDEKSEAYKAGFKTIADIGKERICRTASKIKKENPQYDGDLGFKVFKLDSSNIRAWNPDRNDLEQTLLDHTEHLVEGRSEEDVLYELLLKRGVDLTVPIEQKDIDSKTVYSIGYGVLFACLNETIKRDEVESLAQGIIDWHQELEPASDTQVVFRDSAFADDIAKTNMTAILEQNGIAHVRSL